MMRAPTRQPQAVDAHATAVAPPRFRQMMHRRLIAPEIRPPRLPQPPRNRQRKPGRRVNLQLVMRFHHIRIVKKRRCRLGQPLQHYRPQRKIGRRDDADAVFPAQPVQRLQLPLV